MEKVISHDGPRSPTIGAVQGRRWSWSMVQVVLPRVGHPSFRRMSSTLACMLLIGVVGAGAGMGTAMPSSVNRTRITYADAPSNTGCSQPFRGGSTWQLGGAYPSSRTSRLPIA